MFNICVCEIHGKLRSAILKAGFRRHTVVGDFVNTFEITKMTEMRSVIIKLLFVTLNTLERSSPRVFPHSIMKAFGTEKAEVIVLRKKTNDTRT